MYWMKLTLYIHSLIAEFDVENIGPIRWSENAFARLVLPYGYKDIIRAFVQEQLSRDDGFDDIITGKGQDSFLDDSSRVSRRSPLLLIHGMICTGLGFIMLLSGDPGVGKTLTAESGTSNNRSTYPT
jgi:hypothetical protein